MPEVNEAAILDRAKTLCKNDGFAWNFEWKLPLPEPYKVVPRRVVKEEEWQQYLVRAREELLNECRCA
jgi:hypothetical protein